MHVLRFCCCNSKHHQLQTVMMMILIDNEQEIDISLTANSLNLRVEQNEKSIGANFWQKFFQNDIIIIIIINWESFFIYKNLRMSVGRFGHRLN